MMRRTLPLLLSFAFVLGCSTPSLSQPYAGPSTPTPAELWNQFRAVHTDATPSMRRSAGRRLDDLLTDEAREWLTRPDSKMRAMLPPERRLPPDVVRMELLGDSILARRAVIRRSKLASVNQTDATSATLVIRDGSTATLRLPITLRNGSWRFLPSHDLIGSYEDAMPLPTSPPSPTPRTFASPDAAAQALVDAFNTEDGRLLHDLLDSTTLARFDTLTRAAGDPSGDGTLRILQKMTRDAHARLGSASVGSAVTLFPDRATITINYALHAPDTFTAINDGTWHIRLDI